MCSRGLGGRRSATRARAVRRPLPGPRRPWIRRCLRASDGRIPIAAASSCPSRRCCGYYDLVHAKEAIPESRRPLSDDEARALDDLIANLDRGDVVRCRYYEGGGYREAEGAVSQIDVTFRDLWIVRRRIPFSAIQSLELLYPAS